MRRREFFSRLTAGGLASFLSSPLLFFSKKNSLEEKKTMAYVAKDYSSLLGLPGFSETLLKNHFSLYQGYVANTNKLIETITSYGREGKTALPEMAELRRRLGWEFNGMRLHEAYFENLGGREALDPSWPLAKKIVASFGSVELWEKDFRAAGSMRGIGWVILYHDPVNDSLLNFWINEHDVGHPAGCQPLLVMDVFEHAYMIDYGLRRADYIEAFFKNINWKVVSSRLK